VILGLGLGMVMQVLVSGPERRRLQVPRRRHVRSVLFRQVGGSIGVAVFV
jgi:hypothetical protein